jgi:hypothetical protein
MAVVPHRDFARRKHRQRGLRSKNQLQPNRFLADSKNPLQHLAAPQAAFQKLVRRLAIDGDADSANSNADRRKLGCRLA